MSTLTRVLWFLGGVGLLILSVRLGHPDGNLGFWYVLAYAYAVMAAAISLSAVWTRELRVFAIGLAGVAVLHAVIATRTTPEAMTWPSGLCFVGGLAALGLVPKLLDRTRVERADRIERAEPGIPG